MSALNKNIKKIRSLKGMSQAEFAQLFDLTRANIGSYEEGRAQPKMEVVVKMANHFGLSLDDFVNRELSVNDLSNFGTLPEGEGVKEGRSKLPFQRVPFVTHDTIGKFLSIGRSKDALTVPLGFEADFAYQLNGHHLEGTNGIANNDVLFLKRVAPEEMQHGFVHAIWHKKELIAGICTINREELELKGISESNVVLSIPRKSVKKVWRLVSTLSVHQTNFEYLLLKERIEELEKTLSSFMESQRK